MSILPVERASVARAEPDTRRDPAPARAETPFAELLDAALAPSSAARPLTRPAAADRAGAEAGGEGRARSDERQATGVGGTATADGTGAADAANTADSADSARSARGAPPNNTMHRPAGESRTGSTPAGANAPGAAELDAADATAAADAIVRRAQASARGATPAPATGQAAADAAPAADAKPAGGEATADSRSAAAPSAGDPAVTTNAAHAAHAAHAAGVHDATGALVPEMRARLQRVLDRMRDEYGHDVQVVETYRGQARQDALFAQGRTAPGPVVTWTRSSNHTRGRAADVMIDGGYGNAQAFATLQRVAREEGLHTLGPRDPGHLELKGGSTGRPLDVAALAELGKGSDATVRVTGLQVAHDTAAAPAPAAPPAGVARVAAVAQPAAVAHVAAVARPAAVARVAQVAAVAVPGTRPIATAGQGGGRAAAASGHAATPEAAAHEGTAQGAAPAARRGARAEREVGADAGGAGQGGDGAATLGHELAGGAGDGTPRHAVATAPVREGGPVSGSDALARLDRIDLLREGAAARPLSHITLALDGAGGTTDRVRVALSGGAVDATLELGDASTAHRVSAHLGELQQALEQRGLRTEALQVRQSADVAPDTIAMGRVAGLALGREATAGGGNNSSPSGQQPAPQRERDGRSHPDAQQQDASSSRHRARRDSKEGR